jgi:PAS domain S-box-containing protein
LDQPDPQPRVIDDGAPEHPGYAPGDRARQQAAVAELGMHALSGAGLPELMDEVVALVARTLDAELCKVLELLPSGDELLLRAGIGWHSGLVGQATVGAGDDSQAGYTLTASGPVIVTDLSRETRFAGPLLLIEHGVVSGMSVVIHGRERPYGVLGVHTRTARTFSTDDSLFLQSIANVLAAAIDRARADDALRESEERFRSLVEMAPDVVFSLAADATVTSLSPAFERITGWPRRDLLGRPFARVVHTSDLRLAQEKFQQIQRGETPPPFELRFRTASGKLVTGELRAAPKVEDGRVVEVFGIARDVSARRQAEEELRRSRDELAIILRGVADSITVQDPTFRLVYANDAAAHMLGFASAQELIDTPVEQVGARFEVLDEAGQPFTYERLPNRLALQGQAVTNTPIRFRVRATGAERWSMLSSTPVFGADGAVRYAINIFHDVTDQRRVERTQELLAEASAMLASSLDYAATLTGVARLVIGHLADWCIFDIVRPDGSLRRIVAHADPEREQLAHDLIEQFPLSPDSPHPVMRVLRTGEAVLVETTAEPDPVAPYLDPERVRLSTRLGLRSYMVVPLTARGRTIGAMTLARAESERHYADEDLEVAEELARRVAIAVDNALLFEQAQQAAARVRVLAEASRTFAEASVDLQTVLDTCAATIGNLVGDQCILRLISPDGMWLTVASIYHRDPRRRAMIQETMAAAPQRADEGLVGSVVQSGQPLLIPVTQLEELRERVKPEHLAYFEAARVHSILVVLLRVRDRVIGTLGLGRELPGRPYTIEDQQFLQELADRAALAIENARLFREAEEAVRAREQFLSIASHELKTPLTSVKASAQLLERRVRQPDTDPARITGLVSQLQGEIGRLEHLVADLLDATRIQQGRLELRREPVDLVALARQGVERFEQAPERRPAHRLVLDADGLVSGVWDAARLDQVITNLLSNALKYSPGGGEVRLRVRDLGDAAEITVSDEGIGITVQERQQLFQPFARGDVARQSIGGTGLGLFITAEIVERHGGTIDVESEPAIGSTFTVRLPYRTQ